MMSSRRGYGDSAYTDTLIGMTLSILGAITTQLGYTFQKMSHINNLKKPIEEQGSSYMSYTWVLGFTIFFLGQLLNMFSLGLASQVLTSVLGSFSLVANCVFSPLILKESLTRHDLISTSIIIIGASIVVGFSSHEQENYDLAVLLEFFQEPPFEIYFSSLIILSIIIRVKLYTVDSSTAVGKSYVPLLYTILSGICGATSLTFAKCAVQLVKSSFLTQNQMGDWQAWVIISVFLCAAVAQVHFLNEAMHYGDSLLVIPVYYVMNTTLSIISGLVYFQEYRLYDREQTIWFIVGTLLTMIGVFVSSRREVLVGEQQFKKAIETRYNPIVKSNSIPSLHTYERYYTNTQRSERSVRNPPGRISTSTSHDSLVLSAYGDDFSSHYGSAHPSTDSLLYFQHIAAAVPVETRDERFTLPVRKYPFSVLPVFGSALGARNFRFSSLDELYLDSVLNGKDVEEPESLI